MRLYSRGLEFRRRLGVTPRTVIGGLVVGDTVYSNVVSGVVPEFMPGLEPQLEAKEAVDPPC